MDKIKKKVCYTGDTRFATDNLTKGLMKAHLVPGEWYMSDTEMVWPWGVRYYLIEEVGFWAPCDSFREDINYHREFFKNKYGLK